MPDLPCRGGGVNPTSMAQNDTHVALIILTTQMWGGGGLLVEKTFSGQILCSCAFGANIRFYTKQRARHGTPFLQPPPPLLRRASMSPPPPPRRAIFSSPGVRSWLFRTVPNVTASAAIECFMGRLVSSSPRGGRFATERHPWALS